MSKLTVVEDDEEEEEPIQLVNYKCPDCGCKIFKVNGFVEGKDEKLLDNGKLPFEKVRQWVECVNCESYDPIEELYDKQIMQQEEEEEEEDASKDR